MIQELLKKETKDLHAEVERIMYTKEIMEGSLSRVQYQHLIITNYRVIHCYEQALMNAMTPELADRLQMHKRSKINALTKDLQELGIESHPLTIHPAPLKMLNDDFLLGCLYVFEGATLGGNFIYKKLQKNSQLSPFHFNFFYYQVYGQELIPNWSQFVQELNQKPVQAYENIFSGAQFIFNEYVRLHNGNS